MGNSDLIFTYGLAVALGSFYAYIIYVNPPKQKWTWVSVGIGVIITLIPAAILEWVAAGQVFYVLHTFGLFFATGIPMAVLQVRKHDLEEKQAKKMASNVEDRMARASINEF